MNNKIERLKEYMEKEFGVTPENIDQKLEELRQDFNERGLKLNEKCKGLQ